MDNNLSLNFQKTKEIIVNFRSKADHPPLFISGLHVERVSSTKVHITEDLSWSVNTSHRVKKAQQRMLTQEAEVGENSLFHLHRGHI